MNARNLKKLDRITADIEALQQRINGEKNVSNIGLAYNRATIESLGKAKRELMRALADAHAALAKVGG